MAGVMYAAKSESCKNESGLTYDTDYSLGTRVAIVLGVALFVDFCCLVMAETFNLSMLQTPRRFGLMHWSFFLLATSAAGFMLCFYAAVEVDLLVMMIGKEQRLLVGTNSTKAGEWCSTL